MTPIDRLTAALTSQLATGRNTSVRTDDLALTLAVVAAAQRAVKGWYQEPEVGDFDRDIFDPLRAALAAVEGAKP